MEDMVGKGRRSLVRCWAAPGMIKRTDRSQHAFHTVATSYHAIMRFPLRITLRRTHKLDLSFESMEVGYWTTYASSIDPRQRWHERARPFNMT